MALINHAKREINAKIVYYGCEGAGKRTSMQYIYDRIKPSLRGEQKSLPASGGSLLFFDFSPFEALVFGGYRLRFHIYTLPGKVVNPAAWKMTLKGADGLVVVADPAPDRLAAGRNSILALRDYLSGYGVSLHDIPTVLQLNAFSRGTTMTPDELAAALEVDGIPSCYSVAISGEGVLETLTVLSRAIMGRIGQDETLQGGGREAAPEENPSVAEPPGPQGDEDSGGSDADGVEELLFRGRETGGGVQPLGGPSAEETLVIGLAGDGATCHDGVVRIPLELTIGGASRRLVVSVELDQL